MQPEELIRATKPITVATGKAVAAGNSGKQEDVIVAANMGRKAVADLLKACKVSAKIEYLCMVSELKSLLKAS